MAPRSVTVLGGGLSGLSTAFYLARRFPPNSSTRITLVERSARVGGWVHSERVRVSDTREHNAEVLLESGPRTLRPASKGVLELIHLLGLSPTLLTVSKSAPAAQNRFLHLHGADGLERIPGSLWSLLRSPLARVIIPAIRQNTFRRRQALDPDGHADESVDAFFTRHFGEEFARTFASALVHGIYATDSRILSVHAAFTALRRLEERGGGSMVRGAIAEALSAPFTRHRSKSHRSEDDYDLGDVQRIMRNVSVFSFKDGMQTLTDAMANDLSKRENVDLVTGQSVVSLCAGRDGGYKIATDSGRLIPSSHFISAVSLPGLHRLLESSNSNLIAQPNREPLKPLQPLPHLLANPTSSVTVVNLVFPPTQTPLHPAGFGYLIPRPLPDYPGSGLGMLGIVFDSSALSGQDRFTDGIPFTKITVMLGGPYGASSPLPSSPEFVPKLLETIRTQIGRSEPLPEPCLVRIREHRDCIPTPTVGHVERMEELREAVRERWGERAQVIGAGVGGVSVGDCVEGGRRAAWAV